MPEAPGAETDADADEETPLKVGDPLRGRRPLTVGGAVLWATGSAMLLTALFLAYVAFAGSVAVGRAEPDEVRAVQAAFVVYAQLVLAKGLLPQLVLTVAVWVLLDRRFSLEARGSRWLILGVLVVSFVSAGVMVGTLLRTEAFGLPAVVFRGVGNVLQTLFEMTFGTAAALVLPRLLARRRT